MPDHDIVITKIRKSRSRRKGGGRRQKPPGEGKTAQFQARIAADLRAALDTEAAATGRSVSAIASGLLRDGLRSRREREFERDDPVRALRYLIAEAAKMICGWKEVREGRKLGLDWRAICSLTKRSSARSRRSWTGSDRPVTFDPRRRRSGSQSRCSGRLIPHKARAEHVAAKIILHNLDHADAMDVEKMFGPNLPDHVKARLEADRLQHERRAQGAVGRPRARCFPGASQRQKAGKQGRAKITVSL